MFNLLKRVFSQPVEKRSSGSGYTTDVLRFREAYISGRTGLGELTGTVSSCVSLWQNGFAISDVEGTDLLTRNTMARLGRALAVRGEFVGLIRDDRIVSASDWDLNTRDGEPVAYRLSIPESGGGRTETALAGEVIHVRINADSAAPWLGVSPLRTASLTAGMLHAVESALSETWETMPFGSMIVPMPEQPETNNANLGRSFRGQRGRVLLRESVQVTAAGGPAPQSDWRPSDVTPNLEKALPIEALTAARESIALAYGILPGLLNGSTTGPLIREAQRHLAAWTLAPIAKLVAEECSAKLGGEVAIDCVRPLQAMDVSGRARALLAVTQALTAVKAGDITPADLAKAEDLVDL